MPPDPLLQAKIAQAAEWIRHAPSMIVAAGAGMGIDSGLPDFRGVTSPSFYPHPPTGLMNKSRRINKTRACAKVGGKEAARRKTGRGR